MGDILFVAGFQHGFVACGRGEHQRHVGRVGHAVQVGVGLHAAHGFVAQVNRRYLPAERGTQQRGQHALAQAVRAFAGADNNQMAGG